MEMMFLICAAVGGTVFVFQFITTLIGLGFEELDMGEGGDFDTGGDMEFDADADVDGHAAGHEHSSNWFFGVITFRTVVAALTFFGLAGAASLAGGLGQAAALAIAIATGGAAMYTVHWLMQFLYRLGHEGTLQLSEAVGKTGTVYVPIPGNQEGVGKIQFNLQDRIVEIAAVTSAGEKLPTGARVEVVRLVNPSLVEVKPQAEAKSSESQQVKTA